MITLARLGWRHPAGTAVTLAAVTAWWLLARRANPGLRAEAAHHAAGIYAPADGDQAGEEDDA